MSYSNSQNIDLEARSWSRVPADSSSLSKMSPASPEIIKAYRDGDLYLLIILFYNSQPTWQQNRSLKSKTSKKGIGIRREDHQVLCVNTELCANARREVRGDLKDSAVVA
jgi:hypothetical protein